MEHSTPLISTLAVALGAALLLGVLATRLKIPAIVGYLLAGIAIGPFTPGYTADYAIAAQFAEIGIMLLMFGVGLHFSIDDLRRVRKIAIPGALIQISVATSLGAWVALAWGWEVSAAIIFGLSLSVASTVVLLRGLQAKNQLNGIGGRIAVGWLVVEDLVMVLALVLLPPLAQWMNHTDNQSTGDILALLSISLIKIIAFIVIMWGLGRKIFPRLLWMIASTQSRELFTLCVIATAVSIAFGASHIFGVSFSLGAFIAGMVLGESEFSHRAARESLPLQEAFAVLFFVSVGMLFDPHILIQEPLKVFVVLGIIIFGKSLAAVILVLIFKYRLGVAILIAASLAQIGEFSFILAALGLSLNLLPAEGQHLILAGALISIALNPLLFAFIKPLESWLHRHSKLMRQWEHIQDPLAELPATTHQKYLSGQVVIVGYGQIGQTISQTLIDSGIPHVIAEQNRALVEELRQKGMPAVFGDASDASVLIQAHILKASMLLMTSPTLAIQTLAETARTLNPNIEILVTWNNAKDIHQVKEWTKGEVFYGELEIAKNMTQHILQRYGHLG
jgi:monovalent cation:H+ antiporter-2, CPA2 family